MNITSLYYQHIRRSIYLGRRCLQLVIVESAQLLYVFCTWQTQIQLHLQGLSRTKGGSCHLLCPVCDVVFQNSNVAPQRLVSRIIVLRRRRLPFACFVLATQLHFCESSIWNTNDTITKTKGYAAGWKKNGGAYL